MNMKFLIEYAKTIIKQHPQHKSAIVDICTMARDEIEDGGSEAHEVELALSEIQDLIK